MLIIMKKFSQILKELMHSSDDISQGKLAREVKISQQAISRYLNDERQPDVEALKKFADYFDVTVDYLLDREPYEK